eukprot:7914545-Pyramimonas_sp.AAC.1
MLPTAAPLSPSNSRRSLDSRRSLGERQPRDSTVSTRSNISTADAMGGTSLKERRGSVKSEMTVENTGCLEKAFFLTNSEIHPILCCGINTGVMEEPVRTPCDHLFCDYCIRQASITIYGC